MMCLLGCSCSHVFASLCKPACEEKLKNLHVLASDSDDARNFAEAVLHTFLNSFHAVLSCRSAWLNRSLLFSLCKWIQMMCLLAQPLWQLAGKATTFGNYNNAIHHKQWTIVISAKTIQPNCRFHPKLFQRQWEVALDALKAMKGDTISEDALTLLLMEEILHHLGCIKPCK